MYLDLPGQALDLLNLDLHRRDRATAVADGPIGKLARQMQEAFSLSPSVKVPPHLARIAASARCCCRCHVAARRS